MTRKTTFFEGWSWFKFNNLGLALGRNLKFYTSLSKGLRLKVRKFWGLILTFVEVTGEKLVRGWSFFGRLILNRINCPTLAKLVLVYCLAILISLQLVKSLISLHLIDIICIYQIAPISSILFSGIWILLHVLCQEKIW